jgi:dipeptidyl-peptidase 4
MASYMWAPDSAHLLFDSNGRLWLYDLHNGTGCRSALREWPPATIRKFSPNGEFFVLRDHGLSVRG